MRRGLKNKRKISKKLLAVVCSGVFLLGLFLSLPSFAGFSSDGTAGNSADGVLRSQFEGTVLQSQQVFATDATDAAVKAEGDSGDGTEASPFLISDAKELFEKLSENLSFIDGRPYYFEITKDIDLADYLSSEPSVQYPEGGPGYNDGKGWQPIGSLFEPFKSVINGNGHTIKNLWLNRPDEDFVGLIACGEGAKISALNIVLDKEKGIVGNKYAGVFFGDLREGTMKSEIKQCSAVGSVNGEAYVPGMFDMNDYGGAGGLVGRLHEGVEISESYFMGEVKGKYVAGGIAGETGRNIVIKNSYSVSDIAVAELTGDGESPRSGGIVGNDLKGVKIEYCYFAPLSGQAECAGILGKATSEQTPPMGPIYGIIGIPIGSDSEKPQLSNCVYDASRNGNGLSFSEDSSFENKNSKGVIGGEAKQKGAYAGWNFENIWGIYENSGMPYLRQFENAMLVTPISKVYDGKDGFSGDFMGEGTFVNHGGTLQTASVKVEAPSGVEMKNAGIYTLLMSYDIYVNCQASLAPYEIEKKKATVHADNKNRRPKDSEPGFTFMVVGLVEGETLEEVLVSGGVTLKTDATKDSKKGRYVIAVSGDLYAENYLFAYEEGVLTVEGLSVGAILGITLGFSIPAVAAILFFLFWFVLKKRTWKDLKEAFARPFVKYIPENLLPESEPVRYEIPETLSPRETDVFLLMVRGASRKNIAAELFISEGTVKKHTAHIFDKTGVRSQKDLMVKYRITDEVTGAEKNP